MQLNANTINQIFGLTSKSEIARRVGVSPQSVSQWLSKKIPPYQVIPFCEALEWRVTPNQVDPVLYPNPEDGLPQGKYTPPVV